MCSLLSFLSHLIYPLISSCLYLFGRYGFITGLKLLYFRSDSPTVVGSAAAAAAAAADGDGGGGSGGGGSCGCTIFVIHPCVQPCVEPCVSLTVC